MYIFDKFHQQNILLMHVKTILVITACITHVRIKIDLKYWILLQREQSLISEKEDKTKGNTPKRSWNEPLIFNTWKTGREQILYYKIYVLSVKISKSVVYSDKQSDLFQ